MNRSTPGLPVHHQLPESTQTHVHWISDAIQPSHPLSSPSPPNYSFLSPARIGHWALDKRYPGPVLKALEKGSQLNLHHSWCSNYDRDGGAWHTRAWVKVVEMAPLGPPLRAASASPPNERLALPSPGNTQHADKKTQECTLWTIGKWDTVETCLSLNPQFTHSEIPCILYSLLMHINS